MVQFPVPWVRWFLTGCSKWFFPVCTSRAAESSWCGVITWERPHHSWEFWFSRHWHLNLIRKTEESNRFFTRKGIVFFFIIFFSFFESCSLVREPCRIVRTLVHPMTHDQAQQYHRFGIVIVCFIQGLVFLLQNHCLERDRLANSNGYILNTCINSFTHSYRKRDCWACAKRAMQMRWAIFWTVKLMRTLLMQTATLLWYLRLAMGIQRLKYARAHPRHLKNAQHLQTPRHRRTN